MFHKYLLKTFVEANIQGCGTPQKEIFYKLHYSGNKTDSDFIIPHIKSYYKTC